MVCDAKYLCVLCFYIRWLQEKGVSAEKIEEFLESNTKSILGQNIVESPPSLLDTDLPHEDETTWFIKCDRSTAERMLNGRPEGTFLIRPSSQEGSYALSIV